MPSPPKSARGLQARLTAKVGPLPVWAWAAVILGSYLLYTRLHRSTTSATPVPVAATDGTAQQPASGQGTPADNLSSGLLDTLLGNLQANQDALLAAIQSTGAEQASGLLGPTVGAAAPTPNNAPPSASSPFGPAASSTVAPRALQGSSLPPPDAIVGNSQFGGQYAPAAHSSSYVVPPDALVGNSQFGGQFGAPSRIAAHNAYGRDPLPA